MQKGFWRFKKRLGIVVPATSAASGKGHLAKQQQGIFVSLFGDFLVNINVYHGKKK